MSDDRGSFLRPIVIAGIATYGFSLLLAQGGLIWQRAHIREGYWLLPVNLTAFYFLPLFSLAGLVIARSTSRPTGRLIVASVCAISLCASRLAFWKAVAVQFAGRPTQQQVEAALDSAPSVLVMALGSVAWLALGLGIRDGLRERDKPTEVVASSLHVAG